MKNMILHIAITTLLASMSACSDEMDSVLTQRDWDGTATYFQSADEHGFSMYYKPQVGFVGDPMPFYDPVAKDFKVMYLQDYRPNPEATYHPIFGVATKDGATYESLGELIPCGGRDEQDAAIGTGGTIYNPVDKLYYTFYTGNKFKPSSDQNAQVVMVATSPDFKTWTKNRTFYLKGDTYGYDKNDFRDPFLFQTEDGRVVIPLIGMGLWGDIWGYVALEKDMDTVSGIVMAHKGETPGLGAEIATPKFQAHFAGKKLFKSGEFVSVSLRKGGAKDPEHEVDGISGGTKTSDGVTAMLRDCLSAYLPYFESQHQAAAQSAPAAANEAASSEVSNQQNVNESHE